VIRPLEISVTDQVVAERNVKVTIRPEDETVEALVLFEIRKRGHPPQEPFGLQASALGHRAFQ